MHSSPWFMSFFSSFLDGDAVPCGLGSAGRRPVRFVSGFFAASLGLAVLLHGASAAAAPYHGHWRSGQVRLVLRPNGTYVFGNGHGTYVARNGFLFFRAPRVTGLTPYRYWVQGGRLRLQAANAAYLDFVRVGASQVAPTSSAAVSPVQGAGTGRVLARAPTGEQLTDRDVSVGLATLEFMIHGTLTGTERRLLKGAAILDFKAHPVVQVQGYRTLAASLARIRSMTNPLRVGLLRQALLVTFYRQMLAVKSHILPPFVRVLFHRVRELAFDAANGLLVTSNDVDAYLAYLSFLYQLAFHKQVAFSRRDHRKIERALRARFAKMTVGQRRSLCSMSFFWDHFRQSWRRATAGQRLAFARRVVARMGGRRPAAGRSRYRTRIAPRYRRRRRGHMNQSTYSTLVHVLNNDYVGTMNAINTGFGSPYRYHVKYY
ncbi:MAG: hypothetical protein J7M25_07900 [Deltaproteobacteria bacterium]|nr:hypothetical protein [Deltaproteobacteria bacterium]